MGALIVVNAALVDKETGKPTAIRYDEASSRAQDGMLLVSHSANGKRWIAKIPLQNVVEIREEEPPLNG